MKRIKFAAAVLVMAAMAISMAGCGAKFDAKAYVEGTLDATFKNEISDAFAKQTEGGREAIEQQYNEGIEDMVDRYLATGGPEEFVEDYKEAAVALMKASKYTVGEAVKNDDGTYTVTVQAEPVTVNYEEMDEEELELVTQLMADPNMDEETLNYEAIKFRIGKMKSFASAPVYGEPLSMEVQVVKADNNLYVIPEDDLQALSLALLVQ